MSDFPPPEKPVIDSPVLIPGLGGRINLSYYGQAYHDAMVQFWQ